MLPPEPQQTRETNTFQQQIDALDAEQTRESAELVKQTRRIGTLLADVRWYWLTMAATLGFMVGVAFTEFASYEGWWGLTCWYGVPC